MVSFLFCFVVVVVYVVDLYVCKGGAHVFSKKIDLM